MGVDSVFHLVAKTHDFTSADNTKDYFKVNVEGTRNLLDACISTNIKHFIYFSSVKAMAEESKHTLNETYDCTPITPYGESKLMAEELVVDYGNKYGFKTTVLRLPLVYGPGNKGNVYKMIEAIDKGRFVMMGRCENKRSMVYVGNVVYAALAVIDHEVADGKVYIVTDGIDYTVRDLYKLIAKVLGNTRCFTMDHAYWGPEFSNAEISSELRVLSSELERQQCTVEKIEDEAALCRRTAERVAEGKVIGWFQGRMEWGAAGIG